MKSVKCAFDVEWIGGDFIFDQKEIVSGIQKLLSDTIQSIFENYETYIYFPIEFSDMGCGDGYEGPEVDDPLTIYLRLSTGINDDGPIYKFNLREALSYSIEECVEEGEHSTGLGKLSIALRELADEIDEAIQKSGGGRT